MSANPNRILATCLAITWLIALSGTSLAQVPTAQPPAPATQPAAAQPGAWTLAPPGPPQVTGQPLDESWQQTLHTFDHWGSIQRLYSQAQIGQMRQILLDKVARLSPAERAQFKFEADAKLRVLLSAEANDAREWLVATLPVASKSYAEKVIAQIPDVFNAPAAEIQKALDKFEADRRGRQQFQAGFDQSREEAIKGIADRDQKDVAAAAQARAASSAPASFSGVTPVAPQQGYHRYTSPYGPTLPYYGGYGYGGLGLGRGYGAFIW